MQVMSFNVRYINPWDTGKRSWEHRRDLVIETIRRQKADIIGFQEVKPVAYEFLKEQLKAPLSGVTIQYPSTVFATQAFLSVPTPGSTTDT